MMMSGNKGISAFPEGDSLLRVINFLKLIMFFTIFLRFERLKTFFVNKNSGSEISKDPKEPHTRACPWNCDWSSPPTTPTRIFIFWQQFDQKKRFEHVFNLISTNKHFIF